MRAQRKIVVAILAAGIFLSNGCEWRKKPRIPQQASAPTKMPEPEGPTPVTPEPVEQKTVKDTTPAPVETVEATKPKPKPRRVAKKVVPAEPPPAPAQTPAQTPTKPAESAVQITAELPKSAALQQRQNTAQLIDATETNVKKILSRNLSDNEKATVRQINTYITQAKLAVNDGDLERAYNLATKANLLSNELVK